MNAVSMAPSLAQVTVPVNSEDTSAEINEKEIVQMEEEKRDTNTVTFQADTRPIPFTDLSPDHWAFEAVMNLYY